MERNLRRIVAVGAVSLVVAAFGADRALGQAERVPGPAPSVPCPLPMHVNLTVQAPSPGTPFAGDFPSSPPVTLTNFGGTAINRHLRHTFSWKPLSECCQYLEGKLTIQYRALQGGQSATSSDAGNDGVAIFSNGTALLSQPLYTSFPFPAGHTGTKTIALTPAMLSHNRLSFAVQDDTSVTSATLQVTGCCVRK